MRAVSEAGPLIALSWIDRLDLLGQLFDEVVVPHGVQEEVLRARVGVPRVEALRAAFAAGSFQVRAVEDQVAVAALSAVYGQGESEAIVLMAEEQADLLLLDDRRARQEAERRGLPVTGTIGILREARERGLITAAYPVVIQLRGLGFRVSPGLLDRIQREEGR